MSLNLANIVVKFLSENPNQKYTAREIAKWIFGNHPEDCRKKQKNSTATKTPLDSEKALIQQLVAEIGSQRPRLQKKHKNIKTTEGRPRKFYFTTSSDKAEIESTEKNSDNHSMNDKSTLIREHDLYPLLSSFLLSELNVLSKRIDEKRSKNSHGAGGNKWLYPDLVGLEVLSQDWNTEIKECVKQYADQKTKLWSFEVKLLINRSNVREVFFQAVSNSSWANIGYLVANEIEGTDTLKELRMLSSLHGIGFIKLDSENPSESQILIPADEKSTIDWDSANRLAEENKDFLEFIKLLRQFYQTGEIHYYNWDAKLVQE